jgi:peptidoglycan/xylan/chitin deacetylase (PgdA/CDA1 family)
MIIPKIASKFLNFLFPSLTFRYSNSDATLFLTFDDGPKPGVTEFVLKCLEDYKARATFFCLGANVEAYPELFQQIVLSEHRTGNHSWNHTDAFRVRNSDFLRDIERADELIGSKIFRPPFGRLLPWQVNRLSKKYKIVMWEVMIPDYKADLDCDKILAKLSGKITEGSIIVMHDSPKSCNNLCYILPRFLEEFKRRGFKFECIPFSP